MLNGVRVDDKNRVPRILKDIGKGIKVELGIFGEKASKKSGNSDLTLGAIAEVHEYGVSIEVTDKMRGYLASQGMYLKKTTTHINIPERSFIRGGWDEHGDALVKKLENLFVIAFQKGVDLDRLADAIGLEAKGKIQKYVRDLRSPANSTYTTERKNSSNPLVDTGAMIQAIDYKVSRR
ncbi:hypothetical protein CHH71_12240 [Shouchella clausii]|nr:hypothetical protein CHH71_12240 [Shouchella clausii]